MKTYKFSINPTSTQLENLNSILWETRKLYNQLLADNIKNYSNGVRYVDAYGMDKLLPKYKKDLELRLSYSTTLQLVTKRLHLAMQAFFRRIKSKETPGFPRFKPASRWHSFGFKAYNSGFSVDAVRQLLRVSNVGDVHINLHRPIEGKIKTCQIKKDKLGRWWATFVVEELSQKLSPNTKSVGIDLGLTKIFTLSDGRYKKRPDFLFRVTEKILKSQRRISYCIEKIKKVKLYGASFKQWKGRLEKHKRALNHAWDKINNQRHDFCHQFSHRIVEEFGTICLEDFKPKDLIERKTNPAKGIRTSLHNACLSMLKTCISYKAENAGRKLILVNPAYTTRTCSDCGEIQGKLPLSQRRFKCDCGLELDRDVNAARTILKTGLAA